MPAISCSHSKRTCGSGNITRREGATAKLSELELASLAWQTDRKIVGKTRDDAIRRAREALRFDLTASRSRMFADGLWSSVTRTSLMQSDGVVVAVTSRAHRKHHSHLNAGRGTTWWAPRAIGWWIGILFQWAQPVLHLARRLDTYLLLVARSTQLLFLSALCGLRAQRSYNIWRR